MSTEEQREHFNAQPDAIRGMIEGNFASRAMESLIGTFRNATDGLLPSFDLFGSDEAQNTPNGEAAGPEGARPGGTTEEDAASREGGEDANEHSEGEEEEEDGGGSEGGGDSNQQALLDEKEWIETQLATLESIMDFNQDKLDRVIEKQTKIQGKIQKRQEQMQARQERNARLAEEAKKQGRSRDNNPKEEGIRWHQNNIRYLQNDMERVQRDRQRLEEELARLRAQQEELQKRLDEINAQLGGGGGQSYPINPEKMGQKVTEQLNEKRQEYLDELLELDGFTEEQQARYKEFDAAIQEAVAELGRLQGLKTEVEGDLDRVVADIAEYEGKIRDCEREQQQLQSQISSKESTSEQPRPSPANLFRGAKHPSNKYRHTSQ